MTRDEAWRIARGLELVAQEAFDKMKEAANAVALNGTDSNWNYLADTIERRATLALDAVAWCRASYAQFKDARAVLAEIDNPSPEGPSA